MQSCREQISLLRVELCVTVGVRKPDASEQEEGAAETSGVWRQTPSVGQGCDLGLLPWEQASARGREQNQPCLKESPSHLQSWSLCV